MKKIWFICLCLASLSLTGCFHVPDKDWLPNRNKVKIESVEKKNDVDQAVNSLVDWIDMISSEWDKINNEENDDNEENGVKIEEAEEIIDVEVEDEAIKNSESSLEEMLDSLE